MNKDNKNDDHPKEALCRYCVYFHHGMCNCSWAPTFAEKLRGAEKACVFFIEYSAYEK